MEVAWGSRPWPASRPISLNSSSPCPLHSLPPRLNQMICSSLKWLGLTPPFQHLLPTCSSITSSPLRPLSWFSYLSFLVSCWLLFPPARNSPLLPQWPLPASLLPLTGWWLALTPPLTHRFPNRCHRSRHFSWAQGPIHFSNCLLDTSNLTFSKGTALSSPAHRSIKNKRTSSILSSCYTAQYNHSLLPTVSFHLYLMNLIQCLAHNIHSILKERKNASKSYPSFWNPKLLTFIHLSNTRKETRVARFT